MKASIEWLKEYSDIDVDAKELGDILTMTGSKVETLDSRVNDNKNVVITAKSDSYADLGYFVAELKINGTLNNIKINNIQNGETTVVEIGGELP